jgi:acyl-CoA thioesterase II
MSDGSDLAWLGLERSGEGRWTFELTRPLVRFDGKLYGGTGIGVMTAVMEAETGRDALWTTVQFAASADVGERFDCHIESVASGRRTTQLRFTASVGDRLVLAGLGATGVHGDDGYDGQLGAMPELPGPEEARPWGPAAHFSDDQLRNSWFSLVDLREVERSDGPMAVWARMRHVPQTRASLSFLADMVPAAVMRALGHLGAGTSLDNSMRFGPTPRQDWVLLDFDPHLSSGGYVHGAARVWGSDGTLLAVASQTARLMVWG